MKKNTKNYLTIAAGLLASAGLAGQVQAQSANALIDKLVEKGILKADEAKQLREESDKGFSQAYSSKAGLSPWVSTLKFNGDFRGRYDGIFQNDDNYGPTAPPAANAYATSDRTRFRYRLRFGATASLSDHFEVGLRLGSGELNAAAPSLGGNIFSANTTMNNDASRKFLFVDLAYGKWTPCKYFDAQIGKMASGFWLSDAVWDPDYNPEGAQEKFSWPIGTKHKISFTSGQFVIAENFSGIGAGNNNDTYLFVNQIDWAAKWNKEFSSRLALASMNFRNQRDIPAALETFINQNGTSAVGPGSQNFNPLVGRAEITYALASFPHFVGEFPLTLGAEYTLNPAASDEVFPGKTYAGKSNQAYNFGVQFGSARATKNWQVAYNYKRIESAATWHGLNDDDFGFNARGGTDVKGHQITASYHPYDPLTVNVRYMKTEEIGHVNRVKAEQDRLFFDLVFAF